MELLITILFVFYLLLPAACANMAPVFAKKIPFLVYPVDGGIIIRGRRLLGDNKTLRGVVAAVIFAVIIAFIQYVLDNIGFVTAPYDGSFFFFLLFGFLLGLGAMVGDLVASILKRQLDFKPGERFLVLDQIDWVLGALVFIMPLVALPFSIVVVSCALFFILHILVKHIGYWLGLEKSMW